MLVTIPFFQSLHLDSLLRQFWSWDVQWWLLVALLLSQPRSKCQTLFTASSARFHSSMSKMWPFFMAWTKTPSSLAKGIRAATARDFSVFNQFWAKFVTSVFSLFFSFFDSTSTAGHLRQDPFVLTRWRPVFGLLRNGNRRLCCSKSYVFLLKAKFKLRRNSSCVCNAKVLFDCEGIAPRGRNSWWPARDWLFFFEWHRLSRVFCFKKCDHLGFFMSISIRLTTLEFRKWERLSLMSRLKEVAILQTLWWKVWSINKWHFSHSSKEFNNIWLNCVQDQESLLEYLRSFGFSSISWFLVLLFKNFDLALASSSRIGWGSCYWFLLFWRSQLWPLWLPIMLGSFSVSKVLSCYFLPTL